PLLLSSLNFSIGFANHNSKRSFCMGTSPWTIQYDRYRRVGGRVSGPETHRAFSRSASRLLPLGARRGRLLRGAPFQGGIEASRSQAKFKTVSRSLVLRFLHQLIP